MVFWDSVNSDGRGVRVGIHGTIVDGNLGRDFPSREIWDTAGYGHPVGVCRCARYIAPGPRYDSPRRVCRYRFSDDAGEYVCVDEKRNRIRFTMDNTILDEFGTTTNFLDICDT